MNFGVLQGLHVLPGGFTRKLLSIEHGAPLLLFACTGIIFPSDYAHHFALFVASVHILLGRYIYSRGNVVRILQLCSRPLP